jgi:deferrochelatase/peroxidase EfeB
MPKTITKTHGKTGKHLKVIAFGTDALGVELLGNPQQPEPATFLLKFPGGEVEVSRTTDGDYWVHVLANQPDLSDGHRADGRALGTIINARCFRVDGEVPTSAVYDLAVRIQAVTASESKP